MASTSGIFVIDCIFATTTSWVLDTGCGTHIYSNVQGLKESRSLAKGEVDLRVGNGARVAALAVGTYSLSLPSGLVLSLNNCFCVPSITKNIISVSVLDREGYSFEIKNSVCSIFLKDMFIVKAHLINGLYVLDLDKPVYNINTKRAKLDDQNKTFLWHCRLGHINIKRIQILQKEGILTSFDLESFDTCESCLLGKMTKSPFKGTGERASELLGLIHTDVCGRMTTCARGGFNYFITFTDDLSRYGYIYLMKQKSESFEKFKEFQNEVENQLDKTIKALRSDRGGEYLSQEFRDHLKDCGIISQLTPPGTPQLNGVSERRNRTLLDMVRSMMSHATLPVNFWGYALETAALILNNAPSKAVDKTPYYIWTKKTPKLSSFKIWGCEAFVKRQISYKLAPKSDKCFFVGYPKPRGYYFYNQSENKVFVARDGVFLEKEFLSKVTSGRNVDLDEVRGEQQMDIEIPTVSETHDSMNAGQDTSIVVAAPHRSERHRSLPKRYIDIVMTDNSEILLLESNEPSTYNQAVRGEDSDKWLGAMRPEIDSMFENQV